MPRSTALRPLSMLWRALAVALCLGVLVTGGLTRSNDLFPFGVLDQFSTGIDPDGEVVNTCLTGHRPGEEPFEIRFGAPVGIERADVENNLPAIEADPQLLAPLATTYDARHPDQEPLSALVLCQRITDLEDGTASGQEEYVALVRWEAP